MHTHRGGHCVWCLGAAVLQVLPALLQRGTNAHVWRRGVAAAHRATDQAAGRVGRRLGLVCCGSSGGRRRS
jgi:hypothetical protein